MELFAFDDDYVRRLRAQDPDTVDHFYGYFNSHFQVTFGGKVSRDALDDIRHTTYLRVFEKLDEVRDGQRFGSWVNTIGKNVQREYYRKEKRNDRTDVVLLPRDPDNALEELIRQETRTRVWQVLKRIKPPRDSQILKAIFLDEEPKDAVCERHGVDRAYLRVLIHRAIENFRNIFKRKGPASFLVTLCALWSLSR